MDETEQIEPMIPILLPAQVMASIKVTCPTGCFDLDYLWIALTDIGTSDLRDVRAEIEDFALSNPLPACGTCGQPAALFDGVNSLELHLGEFVDASEEE